VRSERFYKKCVVLMDNAFCFRNRLNPGFQGLQEFGIDPRLTGEGDLAGAGDFEDAEAFEDLDDRD
jgi:hypothetical protein